MRRRCARGVPASVDIQPYATQESRDPCWATTPQPVFASPGSTPKTMRAACCATTPLPHLYRFLAPNANIKRLFVIVPQIIESPDTRTPPISRVQEITTPAERWARHTRTPPISRIQEMGGGSLHRRFFVRPIANLRGAGTTGRSRRNEPSRLAVPRKATFFTAFSGTGASQPASPCACCAARCIDARLRMR